jgi:hypothetical protein
MDPNANLEEQRRIVARILAAETANHYDAARLADLVEALDAWISKGGFLPETWKR